MSNFDAIEMLKAHGTDLLQAVDLSGNPKPYDSVYADHQLSARSRKRNEEPSTAVGIMAETAHAGAIEKADRPQNLGGIHVVSLL
jgi:hypothetical protein